VDVLDQYTGDVDHAPEDKTEQETILIISPSPGFIEQPFEMTPVMASSDEHYEEDIDSKERVQSTASKSTQLEKKINAVIATPFSKSARDRVSEKGAQVLYNIGKASAASPSPTLPISGLDDLRERMEALANGLHSMDLPGLHKKIDKMKSETEAAKPTALGNEPPSLNSDTSDKLDEVKAGLEKLVVTDETKQGKLQEILEKVTAIQTLVDLPPPVPSKGDDEVLTREFFQEKMSNIQKALEDIKQKEPALPETLASLSVFKTADEKPLPTPDEPVDPAPEVDSPSF
jgi:hypothetical protein